jgi:hypothetical protein
MRQLYPCGIPAVLQESLVFVATVFGIVMDEMA